MIDISGDRVPSSGMAYAYRLLEKWGDIIEVGEEFRRGMLGKDLDPEVMNDYISKLTRLWLELSPKIEGRSEFKALEKDFNSYRKYYLNPELLQDNAEDFFRLEEVLRKVLEKIKITYFEG